MNAGQVVSESRLTDALWEDDPPRTATKTLQNYVLRLRRTFREHGSPDCLSIETSPPGYRLRAAPDAIDASVVAQLAASAHAAIGRRDYARADALLDEALGHWRGPSLAEFADRPFAVSEAARLDSLREVLLEDKVEVALGLGRHHEAVAELESLVAAFPLRERLWGQLLVALYRSGRQADALRAYQRARATLGDQLGIEPGPELRRLEQAVIEQDSCLDFAMPGLVPSSAESGAGRMVTLPPELVRPSGAVFVGRRREMDILLEGWKRSSAGRREAIFIAGEPGIGKTSLAGELARRLHDQGAIVLYGRNDEDVGVPYQPFAEALRLYAATVPAPELLHEAGPSGADLIKLIPELAERVPAGAAVAGAEAEVERQRLFEAVSTLLAAASDRAPVLLVVDDLHWAAKPTLLLLRHLLRPSGPARLLVVGIYRSTDLGPQHPLSHTLAEMYRETPVRRLTLGGLLEDEALELVAERAGQELSDDAKALARGLYAETGGNPFFITQILGHLVETRWVYQRDGRWRIDHRIEDLELPDGVRDVVGQRLAHLSERARQALTVAAIVGVTFSLDILESLPEAARDSDELLDAMDEAVGRFLLNELHGGPARYAFRHALIRQVLLADLTMARRARLHRRVGEVLESRPDRASHLGALARHFCEAGDPDKAAAYALLAGRDALAKLAFEAAVQFFTDGLATLDALDAPDLAARADLLLALADALPLIGDRAGALVMSSRAAVDARALGCAERLARAAMVHASLGVAGRPDHAVGQLCEEALAELGEAPTPLRAMVMARLAQHRALWAGQAIEAGDLAGEALTVARLVRDTRALHLSLYVRAVTLVGSPRVEDRLALAEELAASADPARDPVMHASGLRLRALARLELGDLAGFEEDLDRVEEVASKLRRRQFLSEISRWRTMRALLDGRFDDAERYSAQMVEEAGDDINAKSAHMCQLFILRRDQGRLEEARLLPEAAVKKTPGLLTFRAMIALADAELGRIEDAQAELDVLAADGFAGINRDFTWTASLSTLTGLGDALGDGKRAAQLLELFRPHEGHLVVMGWGDVCPGAVDRYLGILADAAGKPAEAERYFNAALILEEKIGSAPSLARTRLRYGRMLARRGGADGDRARRLLRSAEELAVELGMAGVAAQAASLTAAV